MPRENDRLLTPAPDLVYPRPRSAAQPSAPEVRNGTVMAVNASHAMAPSAPLILRTEVFADLRDPGSVRTPDPWPVVGAHINLAADTDRTGIRLTLDNVVSDADHILATHRVPTFRFRR